MYAGGEFGPVEELLAEDIVWHVPGTSPIAGDYRGREAVMEYFRTRRMLAGGAIAAHEHDEMHRRPRARAARRRPARPLGGREVVWRTAGRLPRRPRKDRRSLARPARAGGTSTAPGRQRDNGRSSTASASAPRSAQRARCSATRASSSSSRPHSSIARAARGPPRRKPWPGRRLTARRDRRSLPGRRCTLTTSCASRWSPDRITAPFAAHPLRRLRRRSACRAGPLALRLPRRRDR